MSIYDTHTPVTAGKYFKIEPGQTMQMRLSSEPAYAEVRNQDGSLRTAYAWIIWNHTVGKAQILQLGPSFFNQVKTLAQDNEWGDPTKYDIKLKREGAGLNTKYSVTASPNRDPLTLEATSAVKELDLIEELNGSDFIEKAMWLQELEAQSNGSAPAQQSTTSTQAKPASTTNSKSAGPTVEEQKDIKDAQIQDIGNDPINLDDIPF